MKHKSIIQKNCLIALTLFLILVTVASCQYPPQDGSAYDTSDNRATDLPDNTTAVQSDNQNDETTAAPTDNISPAPGLMGVFRSREEMIALVLAAEGSEEEYAELTPDPAIHISEARRIAPYLTALPIPTLNTDESDARFDAVFYGNGKYLDMSYDIDGIYYRFVYCFDHTTPPPEVAAPDHTVELDGLRFDLEKQPDRENWYGCKAFYEGITVVLTVRNVEDISTVTLDHFDLVPLMPEAE